MQTYSPTLLLFVLAPYPASGGIQNPVVGESSVVTSAGLVALLFSRVAFPSAVVVLSKSTVVLSGSSVEFETVSVVFKDGVVSVELSSVTFGASVEVQTDDVVVQFV